MPSPTPTVGTAYGSSKTMVEFVDVNGDGLPDRVFRDGASLLVRLNLGGDRFGAAEDWTDQGWSVGNVSRLDKIGSVSPNAGRITDTVNASVAGGSRTGGSFGDTSNGGTGGSWSGSGSAGLVPSGALPQLDP